MNFIAFNDSVLFSRAVTALEMESTPAYIADSNDNRIYSDEIDTIADLLNDNGIVAFDVENNDGDDRIPGEDMDGDHASALASAGFGTDEDYGMAAYDDITCLGDE